MTVLHNQAKIDSRICCFFTLGDGTDKQRAEKIRSLFSVLERMSQRAPDVRSYSLLASVKIWLVVMPDYHKPNFSIF